MRGQLHTSAKETDKLADMPRTLLIIDDDKDLVEALAEYLPKFNFKVLSAHKPSEGLILLHAHAVDLIVLDVMLPEKDGIQVCKEIRQKSDVPIVMLTARGELSDRIVGLEIGADDYLPKPFEPRELVARLDAILRRSKPAENRKVLQFKDLEIHTADHTVKAFGQPLELTAMEYAILLFLASNPGVVITRDQIMEHLRGEEHDCYSRTIDVMLSRLRAKLKDDPKHPRFIKTVWGSGYIFLGAQSAAA